MKINCLYDKLVPVSELKAHPKNRNSHPDSQILRLAQILEYQGWRYPIKVSKLSGFITSGHGRLLAAQKAGFTEVPVNFQEYESEAQEYADLTADNAVALWSWLDLSGIKDDITNIPDLNLEMLGIEEFSIEPEVVEGECDEDEVPEVVEPKTKPGDLYILGNHRLLCGDSTNIQHVERLMDAKKADMVFTSPPYNGNTVIGFEKPTKGGGTKSKPLYLNNDTDNKTDEEYIQFNADIFNSIKVVASESCTVLYNINYNKNSPSMFIDVVYEGKKIFNLVETIIWEKAMAISLAGDNLTRIFEFIFVFFSGNDKPKLNKTNTNECIKNLWKVSNINANHEDHKACFPVELVERGINLYSQSNAILFEPFGGSGSTLIACEKTNRKCFMMELDPHYCDVIVARWEKFTGKKAELLT